MATTEIPQVDALGTEGDSCGSCGHPLAVDQRYCLECGARRGDARLPFAEVLGRRSPAGSQAPAGPLAAVGAGLGREWTPLSAVGLVAVIALILVAGVLIGRDGGDGNGAPQIVTVGPGAGDGKAVSAGGSESAGAFKSDWPAGKEGYAVELGVLKKSEAGGADVDKAKSDAEDKGAPKVGALDSDAYPSLPGGNYVVYSGVFGSKAAAEKARKKLRDRFPDARVIRVSKQERAKAAAGPAAGPAAEAPKQVDRRELDELNNLSGDEYVKRSRKLPDTTGIGGKAPPKDNAAPGAGGDALAID